ncbi:MAG: ATP-grasp domain-containing protein [Balneolales bacterium]
MENLNKNVFIVGLDEYNSKELQSIENADQYSFIPLFRADEVKLVLNGGTIDYEDLIKQAKEKLDNFEGSIDGIIGFFDPVMLLTHHLCEEYGLYGPTLKSGLRCEHKYWSRLEQKKASPENIPPFTFLDPFIDHKLEDIEIKPPFWLKPVKSYGGQLGFKIKDQKDLDASLKKMRKGIKNFAEPFNYLLSLADLPEEIKKIDGYHCIAEGIISGYQCTVEGYVYEGEVHTHGFFDSVLYDDTSSFFAYITPSRLPEPIQDRMATITEKVMKQIQLNNSTFNIEYYYDEQKDQIWLLEINTRISQSHSDPFFKVYGRSNHQFMVKVATGLEPNPVEKNGKYNIAGKIHHRVFFSEGIIKHIPSEDEIKEIEEEFDCMIFLEGNQGQQLSELPGQDSYSYRLANIYVGAQSERELLEKYDLIVGRLAIVVEETDVKIES